jgi:hypothetical protein
MRGNMKARKNLAALIGAGCLLLLSAVSGAAEPSRLTWEIAKASWQDETAGVRTIVEINVIREATHAPGESEVTSTRINAFITKYDISSGGATPIFDGQGGGYIQNDDFLTVPIMDAAILNPVRLDMYDWLSGTNFNVFVGLYWTGVGRLTDGHGHQVGNPGGSIQVGNALYRSAQVTVQAFEVDPQVNVPLGPLAYAQLQLVRMTMVQKAAQ